LSCYKYSKKWVDLFYANHDMIKLNPVFFLRGNQYLLEALFFVRHHDKFKKVLSDFESITQEKWFPKDDNVESLTFLYIYINKFNLHFMEGTFHDGLPLVNEVLEGIKKHKTRIDEHHIMVFYYKIASLYFGIGENKKAIEFLDKIISNKSLQMREDLLCFSRILNLVAHYEAGLDYNLDALIRSTYKFLIKMQDLYEVQKEMIKFLRGLGDIYPHEIKKEFIKLLKKFKEFEDHPYEKRAFLYLDVISWLESKIENKSVNHIIREKYQLLNSKK
jgi:tetratricopeptide (TPR) repeat protein